MLQDQIVAMANPGKSATLTSLLLQSLTTLDLLLCLSPLLSVTPASAAGKKKNAEWRERIPLKLPMASHFLQETLGRKQPGSILSITSSKLVKDTPYFYV